MRASTSAVIRIMVMVRVHVSDLLMVRVMLGLTLGLGYLGHYTTRALHADIQCDLNPVPGTLHYQSPASVYAAPHCGSPRVLPRE